MLYMSQYTTHVFCQSQQVLSLRLGEQVETVEIGNHNQYIQYDVTADYTITTQYLNGSTIVLLHHVNLYNEKKLFH